MKILCTGVAGFMGSHVADNLKGHEVHGIDNLSGGSMKNVPAHVHFLPIDITDQEAIDALFDEHEFDVVYHLAAYAAEGLSHFIRKFNYENNLIGSVNLINAAVRTGVKRFVFTSSMAVYGTQQTPYLEDMIPLPEDPYGVAKLAVEQDLAAAEKMWGMEYVIWRPHNVYGERQNIGDPYRNVIGIFMNQVMKGEPMTIFGDGEQRRAFSHIDDVAAVIAASGTETRAKNQTFNVGADEPITINRLAEIVAGAMGAEKNVVHEPPREEVRVAFSDHQKAKEVLGYKPIVSVEDGVAKMAAWAKEHGPRQGEVFENIEIKKGLPPKWERFGK